MLMHQKNTYLYLFFLDVSMTMLYADGKGEVYLNMLKWVRTDNADLQTTGILAVGNFARCGELIFMLEN